MTAATTHREVERKLRVADGFALPDLISLGIISRLNADAPREMTAVYHDTASLALFRWGTTLRRRQGGPDEGWHLKLPVPGADAGARDELHLPLAAGGIGVVPATLADIVSPLTRGERLEPQVTVRTLRTPAELLDVDGVARLELVDDRVVAQAADGRQVGAFREIEVEALDADDPATLALMSRVVDALVAAGAEPGSLSKAAQAMGPRASEPADVPDLPLPADGAFAADVVRSAIATHVRQFLLADVAVRRDLPDAVHRMRVSARRLRSVLRTFGPILDPEWASMLRTELGWIASELGMIRDTEVLMTRLDEDADLLGDPDGPAARSVIDERLRARIASGRSGALAALRSDRHEWLIEDLVTAATAPRLLDDAFRPAEEVLPELLHRAWRSLARAVRTLRIDGPADAWHAARIKAKRARYSVDAVTELMGPRTERLADALADVTEVLGEHQDACVAQEFVRELAATAPGTDAFALGRLHDVEGEREMLARLAFLELWPEVRRAAKRSGVVRHDR